MGIELTRRPRTCWPRRATTPCSVPARCGAPSSARSRTLSEKILYGELKPGEFVVVDATGDTPSYFIAAEPGGGVRLS
jgi:hypothetical protein